VQYELRESLANEFATIIREIREHKWQPFCEAAESTSLDPYIALTRVLVRELERAIGDSDPTPYGRYEPCRREC